MRTENCTYTGLKRCLTMKPSYLGHADLRKWVGLDLQPAILRINTTGRMIDGVLDIKLLRAWTSLPLRYVPAWVWDNFELPRESTKHTWMVQRIASRRLVRRTMDDVDEKMWLVILVQHRRSCWALRSEHVSPISDYNVQMGRKWHCATLNIIRWFKAPKCCVVDEQPKEVLPNEKGCVG